MKNFIEQTMEGKSIRIALNLHSWGNLLVHPINYLPFKFSSEYALKYDGDKLKEMLKDHLCSKDGEYFSLKNKYGVCEYSESQFSMSDALQFFNDIAKNSGIPSGNIEGNGFSTVDYPANGEASDWMLAKHGIYALSPELGTKDKATETFFIESPYAL